MFILDMVSTCGNPALSNLFSIAQKMITIIQILAPILAIIALGINLTKSVMNPDDKKNFSMYKNWLIALVMVFAIPTLVNATMGMLGEDYDISACWNNAKNANTSGNSTYKPVNNNKPSGPINTPADSYQPATGNSDNNNNNSSNNNNNNSSTPTSNTYGTYRNSRNGVTYNLYNQADSRWKNYKYSSGNTIGQVGCMITSIAVVSSAADNSITPLTVFNSSHRHNYPWDAITKLTGGKIKCTSGSTNKQNIINFLKDGNVVVIKVYGRTKNGSSTFTSGQHYMALIDINETSIYIGNGYSSSGHGKTGWFPINEVLTSVNTADYCIPGDSLR